jgi:hypothetical protein
VGGDFQPVRGPFLPERQHGVCDSSILPGHEDVLSTQERRDVNEPGNIRLIRKVTYRQ